MNLGNGLILDNVLCVPNFQHNLLSVQKLIKDSNCEIQFLPTTCHIIDRDTKMVRRSGKAKNGLYYLKSDQSNHMCMSRQTCLHISCGIID